MQKGYYLSNNNENKPAGLTNFIISVLTLKELSRMHAVHGIRIRSPILFAWKSSKFQCCARHVQRPGETIGTWYPYLGLQNFRLLFIQCAALSLAGKEENRCQSRKLHGRITNLVCPAQGYQIYANRWWRLEIHARVILQGTPHSAGRRKVAVLLYATLLETGVTSGTKITRG